MREIAALEREGSGGCSSPDRARRGSRASLQPPQRGRSEGAELRGVPLGDGSPAKKWIVLNEGLKPHWSMRHKPSCSGIVMSLALEPQVAASKSPLDALVSELMALMCLFLRWQAAVQSGCNGGIEFQAPEVTGVLNTCEMSNLSPEIVEMKTSCRGIGLTA